MKQGERSGRSTIRIVQQKHIVMKGDEVEVSNVGVLMCSSNSCSLLTREERKWVIMEIVRVKGRENKVDGSRAKMHNTEK